MIIQNLSPQEISARLADPTPIDLANQFEMTAFPTAARPAAVLIAFQPMENHSSQYQIIYTRRTDQVADHKKQVAFPGGRAEDGDKSIVETALRESKEEIGITREDVTILGTLDPIRTISNYLVTPVVGLIPMHYQFTPEPSEVDRVFTIPISWLSDPNNFEIRQREVGFPPFSIPQKLRVIYFNSYDGETLWGVSAEITLRLLYKLKLL